jgi:hypothetical protein
MTCSIGGHDATQHVRDRVLPGRLSGRPSAGHPRGRVTRGRLLARVHRCLLELFHDLIQVVARRILKGGNSL